MERLLCEPEDRIGSEASSSVVRPNSLIMQERRSGFIFPNVGKGKSVDGAEYIKVMVIRIVLNRVLLRLANPAGPPLVQRDRLGQSPSSTCAIQTES